MKWMLLAACACLSWCSLATAQDPAPRALEAPSTISVSMGQLTPTPEMWFYEQQRALYNDPNYVVRRNAELEAAQRRARIESRRWFGYSNMRPVANSTPISGGSYSPSWQGNAANGDWVGSGVQRVGVRPAGYGFMGLW